MHPPSSLQKEIQGLRSEIKYHNHLYFNLASPKISDREYDSIYRRLQDLEGLCSLEICASSPTQKIGAGKIHSPHGKKHLTPMQSLENTYSEAEVIRFLERLEKLLFGESITFLLEPKIDGAAISLLYENGHLTRALTR